MTATSLDWNLGVTGVLVGSLGARGGVLNNCGVGFAFVVWWVVVAGVMDW